MTPAHKLRLVEAPKEAGEIVAVTGDGVNDDAALKRSDVGVAMVQRGSDVARELPTDPPPPTDIAFNLYCK